MATRSPTELQLKNAPPSPTGPVGVAALMWEARASFGPYLRGLRDAARLSLRAAAEEMGVSFSYLAKLETGEKPTPPSLKVLQRMANLYGRDLRELMHEAGFRFETSPEVEALEESLDARFLRLVTHPELRPMRMDAVIIEMIPPLVKRQWIEFAKKLEKHLLGSSDEVDAIVARPKRAAPSTADSDPAPPPKPGKKRRTP
ncbi:MAG: helix-turn-helix domain-containing protein [Myxococcota bacterium]